jgi:hypothetical protein
MRGARRPETFRLIDDDDRIAQDATARALAGAGDAGPAAAGAAVAGAAAGAAAGTEGTEDMPGRDPFESVNEAMDSALAGYDPQNARDIEGMHAGLTGLVDRFGAMLSGMGDKTADGTPINAAPAEMLRGFGTGLQGLRSHCEEAHTGFLTSHEADLARINEETGRTNEWMWDVQANRD